MAKKNEQKQTYTVLERLRHDGDRYKPGEEIDLTETEAAPLLRSKTVALPGGDAAAAALLQQQAGEVAERLKGDFEAVKAEREAAEKALGEAKAEREAADKARAEAQTLADQAKSDREAAEATLAKVEKLSSKDGKAGSGKTSQK